MTPMGPTVRPSLRAPQSDDKTSSAGDRVDIQSPPATSVSKSYPHPIRTWFRRTLLAGLTIVPMLGGTIHNAYADAAMPQLNPTTATATVPKKSNSSLVDQALALGDEFKTNTYHFDAERHAALSHTQDGNMDYLMDVGRVRVNTGTDINPELQIPKPSLEGIRARLKSSTTFGANSDIVRGAVTHTDETPGGWTHMEGVRGGITAHYEVHFNRVAEFGRGSTYEQTVGYGAEARGEVFQNWNKNLTDRDQIRAGITLGAFDDLVSPNSGLYVNASQEYHRNISDEVPLLGDHADLSIAAHEGASQNLSRTGSSAYYDVFAGVSKKFPMKLFGGQRELGFTLGGHVSGNNVQMAEVRPDVGFSYHW